MELCLSINTFVKQWWFCQSKKNNGGFAKKKTGGFAKRKSPKKQ